MPTFHSSKSFTKKQKNERKLTIMMFYYIGTI